MSKFHSAQYLLGGHHLLQAHNCLAHDQLLPVGFCQHKKQFNNTGTLVTNEQKERASESHSGELDFEPQFKFKIYSKTYQKVS